MITSKFAVRYLALAGALAFLPHAPLVGQTAARQGYANRVIEGTVASVERDRNGGDRVRLTNGMELVVPASIARMRQGRRYTAAIRAGDVVRMNVYSREGDGRDAEIRSFEILETAGYSDQRSDGLMVQGSNRVVEGTVQSVERDRNRGDRVKLTNGLDVVVPRSLMRTRQGRRYTASLRQGDFVRMHVYSREGDGRDAQVRSFEVLETADFYENQRRSGRTLNEGYANRIVEGTVDSVERDRNRGDRVKLTNGMELVVPASIARMRQGRRYNETIRKGDLVRMNVFSREGDGRDAEVRSFEILSADGYYDGQLILGRTAAEGYANRVVEGTVASVERDLFGGDRVKLTNGMDLVVPSSIARMREGRFYTASLRAGDVVRMLVYSREGDGRDGEVRSFEILRSN